MLTLSSLNLPLSSSSTTSRELLSQFSTCSGWRWFENGWQIEENSHVLVNQFHGDAHSKTPSCREINLVFRVVKWCFNASWGLKGIKHVYRCLSVVRTVPRDADGAEASSPIISVVTLRKTVDSQEHGGVGCAKVKKVRRACVSGQYTVHCDSQLVIFQYHYQITCLCVSGGLYHRAFGDDQEIVVVKHRSATCSCLMMVIVNIMANIGWLDSPRGWMTGAIHSLTASKIIYISDITKCNVILV